METRAHHVIIGAFVLLVSAGAIIFSLWLSNSSSDQKYNLYEIVFNEAVTGLSEGSTVQFSGIRVGDVVSLRLDKEDPRKVRARVRVYDTTPVREDTRASLTLTGITGQSTIQLSGSSLSSPLLVSDTDRPPVIATTTSPLNKLLANGTDITANLNGLISRANLLLTTSNIEHISKAIENLDRTSSIIADQRDGYREIISNFANASIQAKEAFAKANKLLEKANDIADLQGESVAENLQKTTMSMRQSSDRINTLVNSNYASVNSGLQSLGELGPAVKELRETLSSLRGVTRRLQENPAGYLLGREQDKEFQP